MSSDSVPFVPKTSPLDHVRNAQRELVEEMNKLNSFDKLTANQEQRQEEILATLEALRERETDLEERYRRAQAASVVNFNIGAADTRPGGQFRDAVRRNVEHRALNAPDYVRDEIFKAVEQDQKVAEALVARSSTDYYTAFLKWVRDPSMGALEFTPQERAAWTAVKEEQRAALLESGSAAAGVPTVLDPQWWLTGAGAINPIRQIASVKRATSNNYHALTAAQISASWDTEGSAVSDDSPTLASPNITIFMGRAYIQASYEAFEDLADMAQNVAETFRDAKANLEASAFATGNGTSAPKGIVTAVTAITASRVSPTTGGTYGLPDVYKVQNALPARHSGGASWTASLPILNATRRFGEGSTGSNSAFWTDLSGDTPPELLGRPIREFSTMSTSVTTGQNVLLYGNYEKYFVCDHVRGTQLETIPTQFDQASGRPNATRGWFLTWRTGADTVDPDAFRVLLL